MQKDQDKPEDTAEIKANRTKQPENDLSREGRTQKNDLQASRVEEQDSNQRTNCTHVIAAPQKFDILCGKDKTCVSHEGSRHFRSVIDSYHERYQKCTTKQAKMEITKDIVERLQCSSGSRFLKYNIDSKSWEEISQMAARDKVSHALRFASQKQKRRESREKRKKEKVKRPSPTTTSTLASTVASGSSETETKSTAPSLKSALEEEKKGKSTRKKRRTSDPLPFTNKEDAELWDGFVKRQEALLAMIRNGEHRNDTNREPSTPQAPRLSIPLIGSYSTPPPLRAAQTYPIMEKSPPVREVQTFSMDDDITSPLPIDEASPDDLATIIREHLFDWDERLQRIDLFV